MSSMELDQTALEKANAENTANKADKEIVDSEEDSSEVDEIVDYNADDEEDLEAAMRATQAELKALERVALKEMLTNNGHALREILRSEKVKTHYVSPFSGENTMSVEDILLEIPK